MKETVQSVSQYIELSSITLVKRDALKSFEKRACRDNNPEICWDPKFPKQPKNTTKHGENAVSEQTV